MALFVTIPNTVAVVLTLLRKRFLQTHSDYIKYLHQASSLSFFASFADDHEHDEQ